MMLRSSSGVNGKVESNYVLSLPNIIIIHHQGLIFKTKPDKDSLAQRIHKIIDMLGY
ncbi:MAG: hypothetical protein PHT53_06325 [Candidatus Omnitrophica bacterium]|nr:hypothetical protein [Candidatus Omnitrophota bacterium]